MIPTISDAGSCSDIESILARIEDGKLDCVKPHELEPYMTDEKWNELANDLQMALHPGVQFKRFLACTSVMFTCFYVIAFCAALLVNMAWYLVSFGTAFVADTLLSTLNELLIQPMARRQVQQVIVKFNNYENERQQQHRSNNNNRGLSVLTFHLIEQRLMPRHLLGNGNTLNESDTTEQSSKEGKQSLNRNLLIDYILQISILDIETLPATEQQGRRQHHNDGEEGLLLDQALQQQQGQVNREQQQPPQLLQQFRNEHCQQQSAGEETAAIEMTLSQQQEEIPQHGVVV
ncbi:hypothetical protein ACA910_012351 [Epithemia clementina (nom. ined.)]